MRKNIPKIFILAITALFIGTVMLDSTADARAGGSRSSGSRGSRSYSRPATPPVYNPAPYRQQMNSPAPPVQQPQGGFLRSMAGGIAGGILGGMLFRSMGMAGGMPGGGGIGLFDILLLAGIGYLIYRFVAKKRRENSDLHLSEGRYDSSGNGYQSSPPPGYQQEPYGQMATDQVDAGLSYIRRMDPHFDEERFKDKVMDIFFKVQAAWMNRDISLAAALLTDEMRRIFQDDIDRMIRDRQINRLENIAVRNVELVEAWQESGEDFITVLIDANLLDYTADESSGAIVAGSKTEPVKFEEYWTFRRTIGDNPWKLSAINQK